MFDRRAAELRRGRHAPAQHRQFAHLRKLPLNERKAAPQKLIAKTAIQFSDSFDMDGQQMYRHACKIGLEGVVSKVRAARIPQTEAGTG